MENTNLKPAVRFPEFTENWKPNVLGKLENINFLKGKGISKADIVDDGKTECIRYGELYTIYDEVINRVYSKTNLPTSELVLSNANDVIIPASGETQIDIATASCVLRNDIALSGDLNIIRSEINGVFLSYYLNNKKKKAIARLAQGSSVIHLYNPHLKTLKLNLPIPSEQKRIADFLTSIEIRISSLKEKKDTLLDFKKGVIQKIFNQDIRFKDNNGNDFPDWEEKILGEIGKFQTSSVDKLTREEETTVFLVNYMNVYNHEEINNQTVQNYQVVSARDSQIESSDLKKGDILFTPSSETATDIGHSVVIFEDIENAVYSYHLMRFRPHIDLDIKYSHYFCNNSSVLKQMSQFATGSTRYTISVGSFSKVKVSIPKKPEQTKIANYLTALDDKIEGVQQKIDASIDFKKSLLQKMFV